MTSPRLNRANSDPGVARLLVPLGLSLLLGCGPGTETASESPQGRVRAIQASDLEPLRAALRQSLTTQQQVLALSGGGQSGAFGAGFLKGWTRKGGRPAFQVVTGTSTGSLISTFAFLGRDYDEAVGKAYLQIGGDRDVFEKRFLLTALFSQSLNTTRPLRRLIERSITNDMVVKVAAEAAKGRRLVVGAVDVDSGVFKPFDLTDIASRGGTEARRAFIDALMASTAIPVAFPPVVIGERTYVDGGVRRNIFLELVLQEIRQLRLERGPAAPEATVYCLVNGTLDVGERQVKRKVLDLARRSVDVLLDESTDGNLLRIYLRAQEVPMRFLMTRIPPSTCSGVGSNENQFDPALIRCLYERGQELAGHEGAWSSKPPLEEALP